MSVVASQRSATLDAEEVASCREVFAQYDTAGSGLIELKDLDDAMGTVGMELPPEHLEKLLKSFADDNTTAIDQDTFLELLAQQKKHMLPPLDYTQLAWVGMDGQEDYSGTIPVKRLIEALKEWELELDGLDEFLQENGKDPESGTLSFSEFEAVLAD